MLNESLKINRQSIPSNVMLSGSYRQSSSSHKSYEKRQRSYRSKRYGITITDQYGMSNIVIRDIECLEYIYYTLNVKHSDRFRSDIEHLTNRIIDRYYTLTGKKLERNNVYDSILDAMAKLNEFHYFTSSHYTLVNSSIAKLSRRGLKDVSIDNATSEEIYTWFLSDSLENEITGNLYIDQVLDMNDKEKRILALINSGYNYKEIAAHLQTSEGSIKNVIYRLKQKTAYITDLELKYNGILTKRQIDSIIDKHNDSMSHSAIGSDMSIDKNIVLSVIRSYNEKTSGQLYSKYIRVSTKADKHKYNPKTDKNGACIVYVPNNDYTEIESGIYYKVKE